MSKLIYISYYTKVMKRFIVLCILLEAILIWMLLYLFSLWENAVCSRDATTTPITIELTGVTTTPWEIGEPIYIFDWLTNGMQL